MLSLEHSITAILEYIKPYYNIIVFGGCILWLSEVEEKKKSQYVPEGIKIIKLIKLIIIHKEYFFFCVFPLQ